MFNVEIIRVRIIDELFVFLFYFGDVLFIGFIREVGVRRIVRILMVVRNILCFNGSF